MNSSAEPSLTAKAVRIPELDVLRCVAALSVLLFHFLYRGPANGDTPGFEFIAAPAARYGYLGVHLFFMISGFVIVLSAQGKTASSFVRSRFVRLFPAYWAAILLTSAVVHLLPGDAYRLRWLDVVINLTMLNHLFGIPSVDGVYWSLHVELGFYLLITVGLLLPGTRRPERWLTTWLILAALWQWWPSYRVDQLFTAQFAPFFAAGATMASMRMHGTQPIHWALLAVSFCLGCSLMTGMSNGRGIDPNDSPLVIALVIAGMFALFAGVLARPERRWQPGSASARLWAMLGTLTYPLYLIHQNIGYVLINALGRAWPWLNHSLLVLLVTLMILTACWALHLRVERPFAAWIGQLTARRGDRPVS